MSKLLRYFALASAVAIVAATAILIVVYENIAKSDMIASVEQQNVFLGESIANSIWPQFEGFLRTFADADALRSRPEIQALNEALLLLTKNLPVLRVKSYNLDGLTVYSSEAGQIGSDGHENPRLRFVLDEGRPASARAYKQEFTAFRGIVFDRDLVETYVPIASEDGSVEAVFELYSDVTPLITGIDRTVANLLIVLTGVFVALYVALFLIVRRGDGIIHRETASRRQVEMQLMQFQKLNLWETSPAAWLTTSITCSTLSRPSAAGRATSSLRTAVAANASTRSWKPANAPRPSSDKCSGSAIRAN